MIVNYECGHTLQVLVSNRDRKKMRENPGICPDCFRKNAERENEQAAREAAELKLPELTGSPKQVAWATTIRSDMLKTIERRAETEEDKQLCEKFLLSIKDASKFIDARHAAYRYDAILNSAKIEFGLAQSPRRRGKKGE